jgi:GNAT superfamily N-acetyltransferase
MTPGSPDADAVTETCFQSHALGQLLDLWQEVMPGDAPNRARFRDLALLNPAFAPEGLRLLWRDSRLVGFGYAIADQASCEELRSRRGWVAGIGVASDERRSGHGTRLLDSCLSFLAASGCAVAELGGNGERYLLPGCDAVAYPAFHRLVRKRGFRSAGSTEAMECDLAAIRPVATPDGLQPYRYQHPADGDIPELLRLLSVLSHSWADLVRSYLARTPDPDSLWAAYGPDGMVGFAGFDLFPGCPGRFGPMGVLPEVRGQGVGARLLGLSLVSMAQRQHRSAWFLWGPEGPAGPRMYASAGFRVNRRFEFLRRDLQAPETGTTSKER